VSRCPGAATVAGVRQGQELALFVDTHQHDGVVKGGWTAKCDVHLQGIHQPLSVHLHELLLGEVRVVARQGEEFVGVDLD
jgi:hypothetical protein